MDLYAEIVNPVTVFFPNETDIYFVLSADTFFDSMYLVIRVSWKPLGCRYMAGGHVCLTNATVK